MPGPLPGWVGYGSEYIKASEAICKRIGWINWEGLRNILETSKNYFQENAERKFTDDLINYLEYKQNEVVRLRNERSEIDTQFSLKR